MKLMMMQNITHLNITSIPLKIIPQHKLLFSMPLLAWVLQLIVLCRKKEEMHAWNKWNIYLKTTCAYHNCFDLQTSILIRPRGTEEASKRRLSFKFEKGLLHFYFHQNFYFNKLVKFAVSITVSLYQFHLLVDILMTFWVWVTQGN